MPGEKRCFALLWKRILLNIRFRFLFILFLHIINNFSDPWPKDRHAKRRLTSSQFLARYDKILAKDGHIQFKTDNRPLFDFSLEEIKDAGWTIDMYDFNLHKNGPAKDNIMTEYEEKFFNQGKPICKLICHR